MVIYQEKFYFHTRKFQALKLLRQDYATIESRYMLGSVGSGNGKRHGFKGRGDTFYPRHRQRAEILECDGVPHWRRCMTGHAACNLMPVVAANRRFMHASAIKSSNQFHLLLVIFGSYHCFGSSFASAGKVTSFTAGTGLGSIASMIFWLVFLHFNFCSISNEISKL